MQSTPTIPATSSYAGFARYLLGFNASNREHKNKNNYLLHSRGRNDFALGAFLNRQKCCPIRPSFNKGWPAPGRLKKYATKPPFPLEEHADAVIRRARRELGIMPEISVTPRSQGFSSSDPTPSGKVAILEQDLAEFEAIKAIKEAIYQELGFGCYEQEYAYPHKQPAQAPYLEQAQGTLRSPPPPTLYHPRPIHCHILLMMPDWIDGEKECF